MPVHGPNYYVILALLKRPTIQPMENNPFVRKTVPNEGAGNLGVDEAVAHDQDVDESLAQGTPVLHLPNSLEA